MSLFINFHKLRCPVVYTILVFVKVLKDLVTIKKLHCVFRNRDKGNRVDK